MLKQFQINTKKEELLNITKEVIDFVKESKVQDGICIIYCPHTTAAITINENADPDVKSDIILGLNNTFKEDKNFKHLERNSLAHIKSSVIGESVTMIISEGQLLRGTWQGIYFTEFDGPRRRKFFVKIIEGWWDYNFNRIESLIPNFFMWFLVCSINSKFFKILAEQIERAKDST